MLFLITMTTCLIAGARAPAGCLLRTPEPDRAPVPLYVAQLAQIITTPNSTAFAYFQEYVVLSSVICVAFAISASSPLPPLTSHADGTR
jgi:hypothetical protein